jgi:hypothetical protein
MEIDLFKTWLSPPAVVGTPAAGGAAEPATSAQHRHRHEYLEAQRGANAADAAFVAVVAADAAAAADAADAADAEVAHHFGGADEANDDKLTTPPTAKRARSFEAPPAPPHR